MRVAVLTLTRDRLEYTKHCFSRLRDLAGCDYDHYVLDQGSTDGTPDWLFEWSDSRGRWPFYENENIGIHRGLNKLLNEASGYDVLVKFDNDCELVTPGALLAVADVAHNLGWICSPTIHGLNNPPATIATAEFAGERLEEKAQIGGICMAIPGWVFNQWRFDESLPVWGGDDTGVCDWYRRLNGRVGYLADYHANHYEGTDAQYERYPEYRARSLAEGHP